MTRLPVPERRRALIAAAIRVVARDGVAATSTRAIAAEAGMPLGALHYVFVSRDDLLAAVIDTVTAGQRVAAESVLPHPDTQPPASGALLHTFGALLHTGLGRFLDLLEAEPEREVAVLELNLYTLRTPAMAGTMRAEYEETYQALVPVLARAARACRCASTVPLRDVARLLVTAVDGLTTTWLADRDCAATRRVAALVADGIAALFAPLAPDAAAGQGDEPGAPHDHPEGGLHHADHP
ncbi:MAG TPA: TetR family transcriptional regulator [Kineosporiaceae bacterium]|nr:TetR family transcriptional regulator [Kineosporiaceae bacterium]